MPPTVTIHTGIFATLANFYEEILYSIDQRFHNYQTTFPEYPTTEAEWGEIETLTAYAEHAGDGLYVDGVHIERLLV